MIDYEHHWSHCHHPNVSTEGDIIVHWKKLSRQQANYPALVSEIEPASSAMLQQIRNSTGWNVKLKWQLVFLASIRFFVILDAYVHWQTQPITNHLVKVPVILMLQSSLLVSGYFIFTDNMVPNICENACWKEWRNLLCHLEQQVADKSWRARPG